MATLAERIRRHLFWLLLATYLVAGLLPGPGVLIARWQLTANGWLGGGVRFPMVLVAVLLFLAAAATDLAALRTIARHPWLMGVSLLAVWLGPALAVGAASLLTPAIVGAASGLLLGLAIVAAMPVANSSAGWSQQSGGNLAWSLGLVVLSILLCPWVTPTLLRLAGMALSAAEADRVEALMNQFAGAGFILWVLAPTITGLALRRLVGGERIDRWRAPMHLASAATLLSLNYANGSLVARSFRAAPPSLVVLAAAVVAALALSLIGVLLARGLARLLRLDTGTRLALEFGLSMKHTGLALGLAASVLSDQPLAILLIVVATPTQHLVASVVDRVEHRCGAGASAESDGGPPSPD